MNDFLLRLVQTARGAPPGQSADPLATARDAPLEIDEEIEAPAPAPLPAAPVAAADEVASPGTRAVPDVRRADPQRNAVETAGVRTPASVIVPVPAPPPSAPPEPETASPVAPAPSPPPATTRPTPRIAEGEAPTSAPMHPRTPAPRAPSSVRPLVAAVAQLPEPASSPPRSANRRPAPSAAVGARRSVRAPAAAPDSPRHPDAPGPPTTSAEEVVRIAIGRIEVRTVAPTAPPAAPVRLARPRQSLDDHLTARDRRRR